VHKKIKNRKKRLNEGGLARKMVVEGAVTGLKGGGGGVRQQMEQMKKVSRGQRSKGAAV